MPYVRRRKPISHKITFLDLALNFTFRCNLSCVGCDRASFIKPEHSPPMTPDRLRQVIDEVSSEGIELKRMRIVGGEPTLHPDFLEMTAICMEYSRSTDWRCNIRIFSNGLTQKSRELLRLVERQHPHLQMMGGRKAGSTIFPKMTRFEYVSPDDAGQSCSWPCPNMGSRGKCGSGVDQFHYWLCPTAGPIDSILDLNAGATTVKQMLDPEFVHWQSETVCSQCGQFMAYLDKQLPRLWYCNGTPVSERYYLKLKEKGFM